MAHVVGVPKRDPCYKCKLPVFLAERLTVGKKIYHRRCLKCARCGSQLTPGSFYETEIDDQYCCETCPDEEIIAAGETTTATSPVSIMDENGDNVPLRNGLQKGLAEEASASSKPVRSSIAARLAFFEQNKENAVSSAVDPAKDPFLRRLSLKNASDEDKSKGRKTPEAKSSPTTYASYKVNAAMNNFLYDDVDANVDKALQSPQKTETKSYSVESKTVNKQDSISDNEDSQLNVVVNETESKAKSKTLSPRLSGSPTFSANERMQSPRLAGSPTFTASVNLETSQLATSPTFVKPSNVEPPKLVPSPTFRVSLKKEALKLDTEFKPLNIDSLPTSDSPHSNKSSNLSSPRLPSDKPLNLDSPRSLGSPTLTKTVNLSSPRSHRSSFSAGKSEQTETSRSLTGSPTFNSRSLNLGSPRSIDSFSSNKVLNVATQRRSPSPLGAEVTASPPKPLRASAASPTYLVKTELNLQTSPRLRASPTFSINDNNTNVYNTPLFIDEDDDLKNNKNNEIAKDLSLTITETETDVELKTNENVDMRDVSQDVTKDNHLDLESNNEHLIAMKAQEIEQAMTQLTKESLNEDELLPLKVNHENEETVELRKDGNTMKTEIDEDIQTMERLSVVRAKLLQFEHVTATATPTKEVKQETETIQSEAQVLSKDTEEQQNVPKSTDEASVKQEKEEVEEEAEKVEVIQEDKDVPMEDVSNDQAKEEPSIPLESEAKVEPELKTESEMEAASEMLIKTETYVEAAKVLAEAETAMVIDDQTSPIEAKLKINETPQPSATKDPQISVLPKSPEPRTSSKISIENYPKELDPFKSDSDDEQTNDDIYRKKTSFTMNTSTPRSTKSGEKALNPFDSSDDEVELEKSSLLASPTSANASKVPPPRPPPPRVSRNPFNETDDDNDNHFLRGMSTSSSIHKQTPVPAPRRNLSKSQNPTPEPTPRLSSKIGPNLSSASATNSEYYGSDNSLSSSQHTGGVAGSSIGTTPLSMQRNSEIRSSNISLCSSFGGTMRSRKNRRAPLPPTMMTANNSHTSFNGSNNTSGNAGGGGGGGAAKELFPSTETLNSSKASTPSSSTRTSPKMHRKKRPAPAPPKPARLDPNLLPQITNENNQNVYNNYTNNNNSHESSKTNAITESKNLNSYPLQSGQFEALANTNAANQTLLEGKPNQWAQHANEDSSLLSTTSSSTSTSLKRNGSMRIIPLDLSLLNDYPDDGNHISKSDDFKHHSQQQHHLQHQPHQPYDIDGEEKEMVYKRVLVPPKLDQLTPTHDYNPIYTSLQNTHNNYHSYGGNLEKQKDSKDAQNRLNRQSYQSQQSLRSNETNENDTTDHNQYYDKAIQGKWKRRKGPAPALPIPPRKVIQMLPLQEIKHELEIIEVQQQGLEKQGVILEKMIRDRCEGANGEQLGIQSHFDEIGTNVNVTSSVQNSKEVEDLILQLFELVNEKNELFRRQAELMYLRRQHRLEQEQADLEYEIRVLMAQPERNKTDSDKSREESLIARFVEVVRLRNEVIESLEMDRLREAEEDLSIKQRLEIHTANRRGNDESPSNTGKTEKLSKKEKKKQKETKKLNKNKKLDIDKDADESELSNEKDKEKTAKKKKKFLFLSK